MFAKVASLFGVGTVDDVPEVSAPRGDFAERVLVLDRDPYLAVADAGLRLISVFDDLKYDRADMDVLSGPMRRRVRDKLALLGFVQASGHVFENRAEDVRMILPKFRALGASPFDAMNDTKRREQDYFVLTPTQTACQMIDAYSVDEAVERIKALIIKHPVNLLRLSDYLERNERHQAFQGAIGHLKYVQREAVAAEPLRSRRALR